LGEVLRGIVEVLETKDVDLTRETELNKKTSTGRTAQAELLKARLRGLEATGESMGSARGVLWHPDDWPVADGDGIKGSSMTFCQTEWQPFRNGRASGRANGGY
jgi:hypothetical protein